MKCIINRNNGKIVYKSDSERQCGQVWAKIKSNPNLSWYNLPSLTFEQKEGEKNVQSI